MVSHVDVLLFAVGNIRTDARTLNMARALTQRGYSVGVVAAGEMDTVAMYRWSDPGGTALSRWRSYTSFARTISVKANIVIGMDLFALQAAKRHASKNNALLYYDMREFYFALGPLGGRGWKQRIITWHEKYLLRSVDQVLVSGYLDAKIVHQRFNLPKPPVVLLNTPPWKPREQSSYLRDLYGIPHNATVCLYQGVVHHGRGLEPFIKAMHLLPNVHLCIVGDGPATTALQALGSSLGIGDRVHWHEPVDYDKLHTITCSADVGLCLIEPVSESYRYALPNKLFEYMMAGIPVLATDLPALREQLVRIPAGMLVGEQLSATDIQKTITRLLLPATYTAMAEASRRVRTLSYEQQVQRIIEMFP